MESVSDGGDGVSVPTPATVPLRRPQTGSRPSPTNFSSA